MQQIDINYIPHYNIENKLLIFNFKKNSNNFNFDLSPLHHKIFPSIYEILGAETAVP